MKNLKFILFLLPILLLSSCFGKTDTENNTNGQGLNADEKIQFVSPEEQIKIATEEKRVQSLDTLTPENLGAMLKKQEGKVELYDRRLFINYLKSKKISSSEKLIDAFKEIEDFSKKEGLTLSRSDVLVTLIGFDQEVVSYEMCGDFEINKSKLNKDSPVFKELSEFCPSGADTKK